jgi:hypothetical protein
MKKWMLRKLEVVALMATAVSLVAHGGDIPTCGLRDAETIEVNVTGDCGMPGVMTFSRADSVCSVTVAGDDTGLPRSGNTGDAIRYGFDLYGNGDDVERHCSVDPKPEAEGSFSVSCYAKRSGSSNSTKVCDAELSPVTKECDLASCDALKCPEGQEPRSAIGACCPVCIEPPVLPEPPMVPQSPCAGVECPGSCAADEELVWNGDECCPECLAQSEVCLEQRVAFAPQLEETLKGTRQCEQDQDCTFTVLWTRCAPACPEPIAISALGATHETLQLAAEQQCSDCLPAESNCSAEQNMPGRPACVDGLCVGQK